MIRPRVLLVGLLAVLGVTAALVGRSPPPQPEWHYAAPPAPESVTPASIHRDLKLVVTRYGAADKVLRAGEEPPLAMDLVNTSATASYPVVLPGDGSEAGWREPYVYWSATVDRGDGRQLPVSPAPYSRCGDYDGAWPKDVVVLGPGERMAIGDTVPLSPQHAGRVQVRGHYSYGRGRNDLWRGAVPPAVLGLMAAVPAFEIASDPVEFTVVRPLDVRVRAKRVLTAGVEARVSDVLEVTLVNQSAAPVVCQAPQIHSGDWFNLDVAGDGVRDSAALPKLSQPLGGNGFEMTVPPGGSVPLIGPGEFADELDGTWTVRAAGTIRVRVRYLHSETIEGGTIDRGIASEWVDVRVDP